MIKFDCHKGNVKKHSKTRRIKKKIKELNIFNKQITEIGAPRFIYNFEFEIQER